MGRAARGAWVAWVAWGAWGDARTQKARAMAGRMAKQKARAGRA